MFFHIWCRKKLSQRHGKFRVSGKYYTGQSKGNETRKLDKTQDMYGLRDHNKEFGLHSDWNDKQQKSFLPGKS